MFFHKLNLNSRPGLVTILHTFGKDLKFNPHLHIITNSKINFNSKFNKLWRKTILINLKIRSNRYYYGYYVHCKKENLKPKTIGKYTARYVRHPSIANGRIIDYNKKSVTFYYKDEENNEIFITKSIDSFITSLIQHIPPPQFKMIRYYGIYSRNNRIHYWDRSRKS